MKITVEALVDAPLEDVWRAWTTPSDIKKWNAASDDWHTTDAKVDLRVGGKFSSRMEAKDGSAGFDFAGTYTKIEHHQLIECEFGGRTLRVEFLTGPNGVTVRETFEAEQPPTVGRRDVTRQGALDLDFELGKRRPVTLESERLERVQRIDR